jgi:hypothetical protein
MRRTWMFAALLGSLAASAAACGSSEVSVGEPVDGGAPLRDGAVPGTPEDGGGSLGADGASADACIPQADEPDESFGDTDCDGIDGSIAKGIFVAPSGATTGDGSPESPFTSLAAGIAEAQRAGKDVYACAGTYNAPGLALSANVRIFGGYACNGTRRPERGANATLFTSSTPRALTVTGSTTSVLLDRFSIEAAPGVAAGEVSAIGLFLRDARVEVRHASITAGAGAAGEDGPQVAVAPALLPNGEAGEDVFTPSAAQISAGTDFVTCTAFSTSQVCTREVRGGGRRGPNVLQSCRVKGGVGGDGSATPGAAVKTGSVGEGSGGAGGTFEAANGANGSAGSAGAVGSGGSRGFGLVSDTGYAADDNGASGVSGAFGGGGGGGAGGRSYTGVVRNGITYTNEIAIGAGGGQGGCGGAGGVGGAGGSAGGASIGVLARRGTLVLSDVTVTAKAGGAGGRGAAGTSGQAGSSGGAGGHGSTVASYAGRGGSGGTGGAGGAGGGGAGGPSVAIVEDNTVSSVLRCTLVVAAGGAGGSAGGGGAAARSGRSAERITVGADGRAP